MALESVTSSSVFTVTDDSVLSDALSRLHWYGDDAPLIQHRGGAWQFACKGSIIGIEKDGKIYPEDSFYGILQNIVPDDNCIAIWENYCDDENPFNMGAYCVLITREGIDYIGIRAEAERHARRITSNYSLEIM